MADNFWFVVVALGPILLGGAIAYALLQRRRLTRGVQRKLAEAI